MPSAEDLTPAQLDAYLAGTGTVEDIAAVERALLQGPDGETLRRIVRGHLTEMTAMAPDPVHALARLSKRGQQASHHPRLVQRGGSARVAWTATLSVLVLGLVWGAHRKGLSSDWWLHRSTQTLARDYRTSIGEQRQITLADGSRVVLAASSSLRVTPSDRSSGRTVTLVGEAYFDIHARVDAPFVIEAGSTSVRVLGTTFTVRKYQDDQVMQVSVISGKVVAQGPKHSIPVAAGAVARLGDSTVTTDTAPDAAARASAWTRGRLVFDRTPVPVMLQTLQRWYGYEFRLADGALAAQTVTTVLSTTPSPQAFAALKDVLDVTLQFDGRVITLRPHRADANLRAPRRAPLSSLAEVGR